MAMSNAERQRKFREKRNADPGKRASYIADSKDRYKRDRLSGKNQSVKDMSERDKRHARKQWRTQKKKDRKRDKEMQQAVLNIHTPPSTPEHESHPSSRQRKQRMRTDKKQKAKCYRENKKLEMTIQNLKRKVDMYKKRFERSKQRSSKTDSPRTKTRKLLKNLSPNETKRCLFLYNVVIEQLRHKYKEKNKKDKANFTNILSGHVLKKYRLKGETHKLIGIKTKKLKDNNNYRSLTKRVFAKVNEFYTRSDNSRLIPGIRQTKTCNKIRKQRRVLLHNLKILYHKFLSEGKTKISYSVFCRLRPFYVVFPRESDRNTCMCKTCNNTELMANALMKVKAIETDELDILVNGIVCDTKQIKCMYRECSKCQGRRINVNKEVQQEDVSWFEWKTKTEMRRIKSGTKTTEKQVSLTVKEELHDAVPKLMDKFEDYLVRYMKHVFRCKSQFQHFKRRTQTLTDTECVINIDFSENYVCKYSSEIQSVHFGASKKQITLHTGVVFFSDKPSKTFCTVSESLNHGPAAVWGHMRPILEEIRSENPLIHTIEIFSDGPATQYKQKGNFYLTSVNLSKLGFKNNTWSFFESGHGKGVPDAVGGSVKRYADKQVRYGKDIRNSGEFVDVLSTETKTKIYLIPEDFILKEQMQLDDVNLKVVPGTLSLHQLSCLGPGKIAFRDLSCSCHIGNEHKGHEYRTASTIEQDNKTENRKQPNVQRNKSKPHSIPDMKLDKKVGSRKRKHSQTGKSSSKRQKNKDPAYFGKLLKRLHKCKEFNDLKRECEKSDIEELNVNPGEIDLYSKNLEVDYHAIPDMPDDVQGERVLFPCMVQDDGNCLPSCGSVYAYGNINQSVELRVRIIRELVMHEECYLSDAYLANCVTDVGESKNLVKKYCQFSEYMNYTPGVRLNDHMVKDIYRQEVLSLTEDRSFMGIWQLFALASVLKAPIRSVYPNKGNQNVRRDLNRVLRPRITQDPTTKPVHVLWTSTRDDMPHQHWVPNHFVPLLLFDPSISSTMKPTTHTDQDQKDHKKSNATDFEDMIKEAKPLLQTTTTQIDTSIVDLNNNTATGVPDIDKCVGQYVIVNFNQRPYPGYVEDIDNSDVQIKCMHQIGKRLNNCFFWPKKIEDISWYSYEDIIAVVSEPAKIDNSNHFKVDKTAWDRANSDCKKKAAIERP